MKIAVNVPRIWKVVVFRAAFLSSVGIFTTRYMILLCFVLFMTRNRRFGPPWSMNQDIGSRTNSSNSSDSPLDIIKRRYANGEISKDEYEEMKKNLS
jgi:putative membrane protein